jgi:hypothetical protein
MELAKTDPADSDDWVRQFVFPEEYVLKHYPRAAGSYYRWFASTNVVDLVRVRRERARHADSALALKKE